MHKTSRVADYLLVGSFVRTICVAYACMAHMTVSPLVRVCVYNVKSDSFHVVCRLVGRVSSVNFVFFGVEITWLAMNSISSTPSTE